MLSVNYFDGYPWHVGRCYAIQSMQRQTSIKGRMVRLILIIIMSVMTCLLMSALWSNRSARARCNTPQQTQIAESKSETSKFFEELTVCTPVSTLTTISIMTTVSYFPVWRNSVPARRQRTRAWRHVCVYFFDVLDSQTILSWLIMPQVCVGFTRTYFKISQIAHANSLVPPIGTIRQLEDWCTCMSWQRYPCTCEVSAAPSTNT